MSLRITQSMLYGRALLDIRNANLNRVRLQQQVATGRRVNRPSDDPAASLRILPMRNDIRDLEALKENTDLARETLDLGASSLEQASTVFARLRELTIQGANGTYQSNDHKSIADEIDHLLDTMIGLGNTQRAGRFLFGGTASDQPAFRRVDDADGRTRVLYDGNSNTASIEVAPGVTTELNLPGNRLFQSHTRGASEFRGTTGAAAGEGTDSATGVSRLQVEFGQLDIPTGTNNLALGSGTTSAVGALAYTYSGGSPATLSINGGPAVDVTTPGTYDIPTSSEPNGPTISLAVGGPITPASGTLTASAVLSVDGGETSVEVTDFSAGSEVQVRHGAAGTVLNVDVSGLAQTGTDLVLHRGTLDAFSALTSVRDLLRNDLELEGSELTEVLNEMLPELDAAHDGLLDGLRDYGNRSDHMRLLNERVDSMKTTLQESLSRAEDADLADTILAMNQQDFSYQAALQVSARIVQTSLLNYLR